MRIPVSGTNLTFTIKGISQDAYYEAVSAYHAEYICHYRRWYREHLVLYPH